MLARLQAEPQVERAEADVHGELLRLRLTDAMLLPAVLTVLEELGFAAAIAEEDTGDHAWYGADRVDELSQAEGRIIAQRVVPSFAQGRGLDAATTNALIDAVADGLHECFTSHALDANAPPSALRSECGDAAQRATMPLIGRDLAARLGTLIEADLASRSTGGADR